MLLLSSSAFRQEECTVCDHAAGKISASGLEQEDLPSSPGVCWAPRTPVTGVPTSSPTIEVEADQRHVGMMLQDLGLEKARA